MQKFRKLEIWNRAMEFIEEIYKATNAFPAVEMYGLTSQIRRSAISIALNIAEGSGSESDLEFNRFLSISIKSSYEVMCGLEIAKRLKFLNSEADLLLKRCDELCAMITGLKKRLRAER